MIFLPLIANESLLIRDTGGDRSRISRQFSSHRSATLNPSPHTLNAHSECVPQKHREHIIWASSVRTWIALTCRAQPIELGIPWIPTTAPYPFLCGPMYMFFTSGVSYPDPNTNPGLPKHTTTNSPIDHGFSDHNVVCSRLQASGFARQEN